MCDTGFAVDQRHPSAVGYVRVPRAAVPALRTLLPRGIVGGRASGYTAFEPFLVTGAAYGGLVGTVTDAVRLAAAHLASDDASPGGHRLLTAHTLRLMRSIDHPGKPFDHGIGWFRKRADADRQPDFVEHYGTGGGFWNAMRIYPSQGLAMVAMTNTTTAWNCDRLFTQLHQLTWI
jgi:CubicO group peptidase (beta-lactamase class C family)